LNIGKEAEVLLYILQLYILQEIERLCSSDVVVVVAAEISTERHFDDEERLSDA